MLKTTIDNKKTVIIAGISSGIGSGLADLYETDGARVVGTYRNKGDSGSKISELERYKMDLTDPESVKQFKLKLKESDIKWDLLIISIGTLEPIGNFHQLDYEKWKESFDTNYFGQLHLVHELRGLHKEGSTVIIFTGGSPNGVLQRYSAYSVAKIGLTKMVEYLDKEDKEIRYVILGPGWVNTSIHQQTINAGTEAGINLERTNDFLEKGEAGTPIVKIYDCINWITEQDKELVGGRNFSVVWDKWGRNSTKNYKKQLLSDTDIYKLRRYEGKSNS